MYDLLGIKDVNVNILSKKDFLTKTFFMYALL